MRFETQIMSLLLLLTGLLLAGPARADVAPAPGGCGGDSETCTASRLEQPGTTCTGCRTSDENECAAQFTGTGFEYACSGDYAGSTWTEVWCDGPPLVTVNPEAGACAGTRRTFFSSGTTLGLLAGASLLLISWRRRRPRP